MISINITLTNGITLHALEAGKGPLLLLLHGFPDFSYGWRKQMEPLSEYFRVVAPDLRGFNLSDKPKALNEYKIDVLAKDIDLLIEALGEQEAYVAGHDWGGIVAWAAAAFYPGKVKKLAVLNMPHPLEIRNSFRGFKWSQLRKSWYVFFFQIPFIPELLMRTSAFYKGSYTDMQMNPEAFTKEDIALYREAYRQPGAIKGGLAYYRASFKEILAIEHMEVPDIHCPVLMLWGEKDKALGKELTLNTQAYCKNSLDIIYDPDSGHFIQLDNPGLVNENLIRFFRNN